MNNKQEQIILLKLAIKNSDIEKLKEIIETSNLPSIISTEEFIKETINNDSVKIFEYLLTLNSNLMRHYTEITQNHIYYAIQHNKIECVKYFSIHYKPKFEYAAQYMENIDYADAVKNDSVDTIKFIYNYMIGITQLPSYIGIFKKAIKFDAKKCLDYCIENNVLKNPQVVENGIYLSICFEKNDILDLIIEKTKIDLKEDVNPDLFVSVLHDEKISKTMFYIVEKYNFKINEEMQERIDRILNLNTIGDHEKVNIQNYLKYVDSFYLNKKLEETLEQNNCNKVKTKKL